MRFRRGSTTMTKGTQRCLKLLYYVASGALVVGLLILREMWFPDFDMAIQAVTLVEMEHGCKCDLTYDTDCLKAVSCLEVGNKVKENIARGVEVRRTIKSAAEIDEGHELSFPEEPFGKGAQHMAIMSFLKWRKDHQLPQGMMNEESGFVDQQKYPYCVEKDLRGKLCFVSEFGASENLGEMETKAMELYESNPKIQERVNRAVVKEYNMLRDFDGTISPYSYLLGFAHVSKITFNLRHFVRKLYKKYLKTIYANGKEESDLDDALKVSLHVRRGDACGHEKHGYEKRASDLYSPAQPSGNRKCYETKVYLKALERVRKLVGKKRHIVVYVSTDAAGDLIEEIQNSFPSIFKKMTWKYLDFPRDLFDYGDNSGEVVFIESPENKKRAGLGETAVLDLFHISHGQVFIGNIGSRFGKAGWFQASGRYNTFVPYYSVDGKSPCCDIDEPCGDVAPYILSMENCLAFTHTHDIYDLNRGYWEVGNLKRRRFARKGLFKYMFDA
mmetsp:Transcript_17452/g.25206  ORF Transcript_17452/g.25206 Transcript_17452/m.25206 type:complete len:500 (-) Transcript_17452:75-1574(-)